MLADFTQAQYVCVSMSRPIFIVSQARQEQREAHGGSCRSAHLIQCRSMRTEKCRCSQGWRRRIGIKKVAAAHRQKQCHPRLPPSYDHNRIAARLDLLQDGSGADHGEHAVNLKGLRVQAVESAFELDSEPPDIQQLAIHQ